MQHVDRLVASGSRSHPPLLGQVDGHMYYDASCLQVSAGALQILRSDKRKTAE